MRIRRESVLDREKNKWWGPDTRICLDHRDTSVIGTQGVRGKGSRRGSLKDGQGLPTVQWGKDIVPIQTQNSMLWKPFLPQSFKTGVSASKSFFSILLLSVFIRNLYIEPSYQKNSFWIYVLAFCYKMSLPKSSWFSNMSKLPNTHTSKKVQGNLTLSSYVRWFRIESSEMFQKLVKISLEKR